MDTHFLTRGAAVIGLALVLSAPAGAQPSAKLWNGTAAYRACSGESFQACWSYMYAFFDMHAAIISPKMGPIYCAPEGFPNGWAINDLQATLTRWYDAHPEGLALPAVIGIAAAFRERFPCD